MLHLHNHLGFNPSQHIWQDFGNFTTLSVLATTLLSLIYSFYLWCSLRSIPIINSRSNIQTVYQRLLGVIRNHIYKIFAGNLFVVVIVMVLLLGFVERWRTGYLSVAYMLGAMLVSVVALVSSRLIAETSAKVVHEAEQYTLNEKFVRLGVAKQGSTLVASLTMSIVLLFMFLLHLFYNRFAHSLVRRQLLHCMVSFAFGGISTALVLSSIGGILSKGFDIGTDTHGKIRNNQHEDSARNLGSLYDAAGDVLGKGISASARKAATFITIIAVAMLITHFETKSIDGTSIAPDFIHIPYLIASIALLSHTIISIVMNCTKSSNMGIKGIQLGTVLNLNFFLLLIFVYKQPFLLSGFRPQEAGFIKVFIALASGLVVGTLIALQSQIFASPRCRFFRQIYQSTATGASTNLIQGLATGYLVTLLPTIFISLILFFVYQHMNSYGIAIAALGMGSTLPIVLNVVNVNTIIDCALCLSKHTTLNNQSLFLRPDLQETRFDQYYVRMFSVTLNVLSGIALFLFLLSILPSLSTNYAVEFGGLLIGAMFPYIILSFNLRASASLASQFAAILKNLKSIGQAPNIYLLSLWEVMLFTLSCLLIILLPILLAKTIGTTLLKGFIAGCLVSGLQIVISSLSSGSILAMVNQRIEAEHITRSLRSESEEEIMWKAGTVGDNVGDVLKDLGEPVVNLLVSSVIMVAVMVEGQYLAYLF